MDKIRKKKKTGMKTKKIKNQFSIFDSSLVWTCTCANAQVLLVKTVMVFYERSKKLILDLSGIEPLTPCLQSRCSPS